MVSLKTAALRVQMLLSAFSLSLRLILSSSNKRVPMHTVDMVVVVIVVAVLIVVVDSSGGVCVCVYVCVRECAMMKWY